MKKEEGLIPNVEVRQNTALQQQIIENRNPVLPIIETVIFCGRQGIPLRGHRDHGKLNLEICPVENEGNFRARLRFRANSGDEALKKHLEKGSKNALYLSPKTQNEIILALNDIMLKKLIEMVNSAKSSTVLADGTTDISTQEQASIGVRYLYNNDIKEDFLQFVPVSDLTGKNLATVILKSLREFGIDTKYLRGQGYDGAAAIRGKFNRAQAYVMEEHPTAIYVHCISHSLNLAISVHVQFLRSEIAVGLQQNYVCFLTPQKEWRLLQQQLINCSLKPNLLV
ncbi:zinc finger MYM-type protein 1-like [Harmonia axyridis]|uniref:zinc finger MYM-type protein 1-like n=1 Tax=Harmonia axyridis TaxID=115357 RepID=UPI001E279D6D|nr:zinc finger MYM-type protein 1-like [Harmonia axyridis]